MRDAGGEGEGGRGRRRLRLWLWLGVAGGSGEAQQAQGESDHFPMLSVHPLRRCGLAVCTRAPSVPSALSPRVCERRTSVGSVDCE